MTSPDTDLSRVVAQSVLPEASALPPLRILSLDGGGARGIVALKVLERIFDTPELKNVKPCEFFDLMVGSECD